MKNQEKKQINALYTMFYHFICWVFLGGFVSSCDEGGCTGFLQNSPHGLNAPKVESHAPAFIYILHGLNDDAENAELKMLKNRLEGKFLGASVEVVAQGGVEESLTRRANKVLDVINANGGVKNTSQPIVLVGYSAGGLVAIQVAKQLEEKGKSVSVCTINSPLGGVETLESEYGVVREFAERVAHLHLDDLKKESKYLKNLHEVVGGSAFPILSIGSSINLGEAKGILKNDLQNFITFLENPSQGSLSWGGVRMNSDICGLDTPDSSGVRQNISSVLQKLKRKLDDSSIVNVLDNSDGVVGLESQLFLGTLERQEGKESTIRKFKNHAHFGVDLQDMYRIVKEEIDKYLARGTNSLSEDNKNQVAICAAGTFLISQYPSILASQGMEDELVSFIVKQVDSSVEKDAAV